jgi:hypothetical protein
LDYDSIVTSTVAPSKSNIVVMPWHIRVRVRAIILQYANLVIEANGRLQFMIHER